MHRITFYNAPFIKTDLILYHVHVGDITEENDTSLESVTFSYSQLMRLKWRKITTYLILDEETLLVSCQTFMYVKYHGIAQVLKVLIHDFLHFFCFLFLFFTVNDQFYYQMMKTKITKS